MGIKMWFSIRKAVILGKVKEIKGLYGGILLYAAQASPYIDAEIVQKGNSRMKTN
jgi:hypothetical protein